MSINPTLLYVEDDEGIRHQLRKFLHYFSSELFIAHDGKEGLELYKKHAPEIVITDIKMPNMNGIEMTKAIKKINPKQPIIFTTAHSESGFLMDAIDLQVEGYISKPIDLDKLESKLACIKEHIDLKKFYISYQNDLKEKAYTDRLTGIHNRAYFEEEFEKEVARHEREKTPFCFILFDIDHFKSLNDTYGHQIGDDALVNLAKIIEKQIRATDIFARWGGDEFVCILPNTALNDAVTVAEGLRKAIEEQPFEKNLKLTCSFGVTDFRDDDRLRNIIKRADNLLYRAKENGRNRVEVGKVHDKAHHHD